MQGRCTAGSSRLSQTPWSLLREPGGQTRSWRCDLLVSVNSPTKILSKRQKYSYITECYKKPEIRVLVYNLCNCFLNIALLCCLVCYDLTCLSGVPGLTAEKGLLVLSSWSSSSSPRPETRDSHSLEQELSRTIISRETRSDVQIIFHNLFLKVQNTKQSDRKWYFYREGIDIENTLYIHFSELTINFSKVECQLLFFPEWWWSHYHDVFFLVWNPPQPVLDFSVMTELLPAKTAALPTFFPICTTNTNTILYYLPKHGEVLIVIKHISLLNKTRCWSIQCYRKNLM